MQIHWVSQVNVGDLKRFSALVLALLHECLFVDITEKFEVSKVLLVSCGHEIESVILGLAAINGLSEWVFFEPSVQSLLA